MKEKIIYQETYKKHAAKFSDDQIPILKHLPPEFDIEDVYLLAAGQVLREGKELEYQDIRIYMTEKIKV